MEWLLGLNEVNIYKAFTKMLGSEKVFNKK